MAIQKTSLLLAPFVFAFACSSEPAGNEPGETPDSVDQVAGRYEVTSNYDLSQSPDLPNAISTSLGPLSGLADNPAGTMLDALQAQGGTFGDLLGSIGPFRSLLESELNRLIEDKLYNNAPVAEEIVRYTSMISGMLTDFDVVTELDVGNADEAGNAFANHALAGVVFELEGERQLVNTPEIINQLSIARDVDVNIDLAAGSLAIGDHALHLPLGDLAVTGFHALLSSQLGADDLGDALDQLVGCDNLAEQVQGIPLPTQTIGDVCRMGLDAVAAEVDKKIAQIEFAELRMTGGEAALEMGSLTVESLNGSWDAAFGINGNPVNIPASFGGLRMQ